MELNGEKIHPKKIHVFQPYDILTLGTPGGAGFWDPKERDRQKLRKDLKDGLVSEEKVQKDYGK